MALKAAYIENSTKMSTQKPVEWVNALITRFDSQVRCCLTSFSVRETVDRVRTENYITSVENFAPSKMESASKNINIVAVLPCCDDMLLLGEIAIAGKLIAEKLLLRDRLLLENCC